MMSIGEITNIYSYEDFNKLVVELDAGKSL
jgi:hypothetical protein